MAVTTAAAVHISSLGGNRVGGSGPFSANSTTFVKTKRLEMSRKDRSRTSHNLSIRAQYNERSSGNGADFLAGFVLGGAIFGTVAYIFAPQIRRSLLNENEHGFKRARRPIYYDEGDEGFEIRRLRQSLNDKVSQLNSAIENVSSRLRGRNKSAQVPDEIDAEEAATF